MYQASYRQKQRSKRFTINNNGLKLLTFPNPQDLQWYTNYLQAQANSVKRGLQISVSNSQKGQNTKQFPTYNL